MGKIFRNDSNYSIAAVAAVSGGASDGLGAKSP